MLKDNSLLGPIHMKSKWERKSKQRQIQDFSGGVKFDQKVNENEKNWTAGARPKFYYVDPPPQKVQRTSEKRSKNK